MNIQPQIIPLADFMDIANQLSVFVVTLDTFDQIQLSDITFLNKVKEHGAPLAVFTSRENAQNWVTALLSLDAVDYVVHCSDFSEAVRMLPPHKLVVRTHDGQPIPSPYPYQPLPDDPANLIHEEDALIGKQQGRANTYHTANEIARHTYLKRMKTKYTSQDIIGYLENAKDIRVAVIGDTIIDDYQFVQAIGKSSKEPTLVARLLQKESYLGGILAVANHIANFTPHVELVSMLGTRNALHDFIYQNLNHNIKARFVNRADAPTIVKRRFIEDYFNYKLFEVYDIDDSLPDLHTRQEFMDLLEGAVSHADLVVVVDFGHGLLSEDAITYITQHSKYLALNVQINAGNPGYRTISAYPSAHMISISENEMRLETRRKSGSLEDTIENYANRMGVEYFNISRGKHGSLTYHHEQGFVQTPAMATQIVDRIGAGDAFLAITALAAVQHAPVDVLAYIGNMVGALAVETMGNRDPINKTRLIQSIERAFTETQQET